MKNNSTVKSSFFKSKTSSIGYAIVLIFFIFLSAKSSTALDKENTNPNAIAYKSKADCSLVRFATIQPVQSGLWSQTSTWPGGTLPTSNDDVVIPAGITLTMIGTCRAKSVRVNGKLNAVNWQEPGAWVDLEAKYIMVMGANAVMEIGTKNQHYQSNLGCKITLTGSNPNEMIPGTSINSKALMVMNGATLEMHGKPKTPWVKIGDKAELGATSITLSEPVDWEIGDQIVITSNRLNPYEAEEKIITAITNGGTVVSFNTPMAYPRMGELKAYSKPDNSQSWNVDTRVEVGLLSRNITIQGDATSSSNGFGGHIMIMNGSNGNADNVELHRMGQKATLARYPWHWHMLGSDGNGQYLKNSSINVSYNRAVTIHGTWGTQVDNNVAYDHIGHGIFLEDGSEINNVISNNLVLLTRQAAEGENLLDTDREPYQKFQNSSPSSFWITNPNNTFIDNIVAGSDGTAYWFAFPQKPTGLSATDPRFSSMEPVNLNLGRFDGNAAHSSVNGIDINDQLNNQHELRPNGRWNNSQQAVFNDLTFFSNYFSLYAGIGDQTEDVVYNNVISTDVMVHLNFATRHVVQNSIFIADSDAGLLDDIPYTINSLTGTRYFYRLYDGAARVYDSHFVNWNRSNTSFFRNNGAAQKRINHLFRGLTFNHDGAPRVNTPASGLPTNGNALRCPQLWGNIIRDLDGSLTNSGVPNSIVPDVPFYQLSNLNKPSNWSGLTSVSEKFVYCRFPNQPVTVVSKELECGNIEVLNTVQCELGGVQQLHLPLNHGKYEHSIYATQLSGTSFNFVVESELNEGDGLLVRFKGFGNLNGIQIDGITASSSTDAVLNSNTTAYFKDDGDLFVKFVTTNYYKGRDYNLRWISGSLPNLTPEGPVTVDDCNFSVDDSELSSKIIMYPVPATKKISIILPKAEKTDVRIINMLGQVLHQETIEFKKHTLSLDEMGSGVYFLTLIIDGKKIQKSFVKY